MTDSISNKDVYRRIKLRRTDIGMSQSELAKKVGYSDKTMISKIERGVIDLPLPKLNAIANALDISPAKLLGWDDVPETKEVRELNAEIAVVDASLVTKFAMLNEKDQVIIMNMIDSLLEKY